MVKMLLSLLQLCGLDCPEQTKGVAAMTSTCRRSGSRQISLNRIFRLLYRAHRSLRACDAGSNEGDDDGDIHSLSASDQNEYRGRAVS